jgi:hypothetical protein
LLPCFNEIREQGIDIVGAATLCASPDLGQMTAAITMLFVLHGVTP